MEHKFKVDDRVTHPLFGKGAIIDDYEALNYQNGRYGIKFEALIETIWVRDISNLSLAEPENPQPKYKDDDIVWAKVKIIHDKDSDGDYEVCNPYARDYSILINEKDLRPLHDEPIKPGQIKEGTKVLVEGTIIADGISCYGTTGVLFRSIVHGESTDKHVLYVDPRKVYLRHEDE